ncbi:MAG: S26 family signal peptidase [Puniceicoccales bacterium]|nr:S26 family signal peptidase [Puniceicoccales bacterium]
MFVFGDNLKDSYDSMFWGLFPEKSICGNPLVMFYPFTNRWCKCKYKHQMINFLINFTKCWEKSKFYQKKIDHRL